MHLPSLRVLAVASCLVASTSWSSAQTPAARLAPSQSAEISVLSLNLAMESDPAPLVEAIRAVCVEIPDVLMFQEVAALPGQPSVAEQIAKELGMQAVYRPSFTLADGRTIGLATLSRFQPINDRVLPLKRFSLAFRSRERVALATAFETPGGVLRTYNVHLDTRINVNDRIDQVSAIIEDIDSAPDRALIAGDFNTNDNFWVFHTIPVPFLGRQGHGLERYMARHGLVSAFDGGSTHDVLRMRLDWMFLKGLQPTARSIHPVTVSDHHALRVSLQ